MRFFGAPLIRKAHDGYESASWVSDAGPARGGLGGQKMQKQKPLGVAALPNLIKRRREHFEQRHLVANKDSTLGE
ncbi:hypothetical protein D6779_05790, partial [Candidatus Parcubacteria bacterium]